MYRLFILSLFILSLPVGGLISVGILLTSGFPVLFTQKRVGKNGTQFILIKFRTMRKGTDQMQNSLRQRNEASGPAFKMRNDPRFTSVGKFLSHTGLDELPQLWNIIKGDMALFGPRPLPAAEVKKLKPWQHARHRIKPGIISPWILEGYHRTSFDNWMKSDIKYTKGKSFVTDCILLVKTIVFMGKLFVDEFEDRLRFV